MTPAQAPPGTPAAPENTLTNPGVPAERAAYWGALAAVVVLLLSILWIPAYNTLVDYPAHLARAWVLHTYDQSPFFQTVFIRSLDPLPNLAIDLIVPPLMYFLPPIAAGKVFLSLIVILFAAGCHMVAHAVYGRPSWMVPVATFAVFNSPFLYGFVNASFSAALFLVTLGLWLKARRHGTVIRWLAIALLTTMTYIAHLSGFVFLGCAFAVFELLEYQKARKITSRVFVGFSVLLPAIAIQLYPWANRIPAGAEIHWGTLSKKTLGLASVFLGFRYDVDILAVLILVVAIGLVAVKGGVRFQPLLFSLGVSFIAASFVCPAQLAGADAADARFVPPGMVFLFLSFTACYPRRIGRTGLTLAFAAMLLKTGEIGWSLSGISSRAALQVAALGGASPNSRIYDMFLRPNDRQADKQIRGNWLVSSYAVIERQSVPSHFYSLRGQQPIYFRNPSEWTAQMNPTSLDSGYLDAHLVNFDYIWGCNLDSARREYIELHASPVSSGDVCSLWKISR